MSYSPRQVYDLYSAVPCPSPWGKSPRRGRSPSAKKGLKYEKEAHKAIPGSVFNQWFHFWDKAGPGFCAPDLLLPLPNGEIIVFECKLKDTEDARKQLLGLYLPVIRAAFNRPTRGIIIARHLAPFTPSKLVTGHVAGALAFGPETIPVIHWLGSVPLWPTPEPPLAV